MAKTRVLVVALIVVSFGVHARPSPAFVQSAEVIIEWNQILQGLVPTTPSNAFRTYAMMHIAMFDAINSIEEDFTPYHVRVRSSHGASQIAAAAQAAHDVLAAVLPAHLATLDAALESQLAGL